MRVFQPCRGALQADCEEAKDKARIQGKELYGSQKCASWEVRQQLLSWRHWAVLGHPWLGTPCLLGVI